MSTIKIRRNTAAAAAASNPVLAAGELGYETDTGRGKMGNGSTAWNALPYLDRHALAAAIPKALIDAKGDLIVGTANDTVGRIAAPANGRRLVADSAQATGWRATGVGEYEGTGSPVGVVAAPVGSVYVDTAATNGALVWRKWPGTGASGWRPEVADTGNRELATFESGWTFGRVLVRRIGARVIWRITAPNATSATATLAVPTPGTGFRPGSGANTNFSLRTTGTDQIVWGSVSPAGALYLAPSPPSPYQNGATEFRYVTDDPWPTTLPGAPA